MNNEDLEIAASEESEDTKVRSFVLQGIERLIRSRNGRNFIFC